MRLIPDTQSIPGIWRWRPNPLRRRSDVVEAWAGLAAVAIAAVCAPAAGIAAGRAVDSSLHKTVAAQRAQRHEVRATVVSAGKPASRGIAEIGSDATSHPVRIAWTGLDHKTHHADVIVVGRHSNGTVLRVWADRAERLTDPPLDSATATSNGIAAGVGAAAGVAALVMAARQFLGWRLLRRRLADWERDWARVSGDWAGAEG